MNWKFKAKELKKQQTFRIDKKTVLRGSGNLSLHPREKGNRFSADVEKRVYKFCSTTLNPNTPFFSLKFLYLKSFSSCRIHFALSSVFLHLNCFSGPKTAFNCFSFLSNCIHTTPTFSPREPQHFLQSPYIICYRLWI